MKKIAGRRKFLIGGAILLIALGVLLFQGFAGGTTYYFEVSELLAQGNAINGETVKVNGQVIPGSVEQSAQGTALKFAINDVKDSAKTLTVFYRGVVPDSFRVGNEVVAEGKLDTNGVFQASSLMPKCPSKYKPLE